MQLGSFDVSAQSVFLSSRSTDLKIRTTLCHYKVSFIPFFGIQFHRGYKYSCLMFWWRFCLVPIWNTNFSGCRSMCHGGDFTQNIEVKTLRRSVEIHGKNTQKWNIGLNYLNFFGYKSSLRVMFFFDKHGRVKAGSHL